jgi:hypothetical protein
VRFLGCAGTGMLSGILRGRACFTGGVGAAHVLDRVEVGGRRLQLSTGQIYQTWESWRRDIWLWVAGVEVAPGHNIRKCSRTCAVYISQKREMGGNVFLPRFTRQECGDCKSHSTRILCELTDTRTPNRDLLGLFDSFHSVEAMHAHSAAYQPNSCLCSRVCPPPFSVSQHH